MEEKIYCSHCGNVIESDDYDTIYGEPICEDCVDRYTTVCDRCDEIVWDDDVHTDESTCVCHRCFENYYTRCEECDSIIYNDDAYEYDDYYYCHDCYQNIRRNASIHEYGYKPEPIFYGDSNRYFGVELEIDGAGKDDDYAEELLEIANVYDEHIYIKTDGSLDDGMEIVTHPMSLDYHKRFCWENVMKKAVYLGYRSHQTSTCGLHVHVNRDSLGIDREEQDEVISRILYFVEHHWNEILKFSRRTEYTMNRWAARYGYENSPKAIMDKAKKSYGCYVAVNLCNCHTIEFRLFRGTLKHNTLIATLELVNKICELAVLMNDDEIAKLSWSEFVVGLYAYASTESIIMNALKKVGMKNIPYTKIETVHGDIIKIDNNGFLSRSEFEDKDDFRYASWLRYSYDDFEDDYYTQHEQLLFDICNTFGVDEDDIALLLDYGYTADEIEDMLMDCDLLHATIQSIKCNDYYDDFLMEV